MNVTSPLEPINNGRDGGCREFESISQCARVEGSCRDEMLHGAQVCLVHRQFVSECVLKVVGDVNQFTQQQRRGMNLPEAGSLLI